MTFCCVLDDWRLDAQGRIEGGFDDPAEAREAGRIGPLLAVNGKTAPATFDFAANARVRLRLANLANARIMILTFDNVQPFVIAIDSQPCDAFEPVRRSIPVAPGARFELIFDMPATEGARARVTLRGANRGRLRSSRRDGEGRAGGKARPHLRASGEPGFTPRNQAQRSEKS